MAIGNDTSLLFRIKGDATDAIRALNTTQREAAQLTGTTTGLASGLASMVNPAALAAAGLAALGTAAVAVSLKLFNLTKEAAEFGSAIFDASQKTGLGAETLSALKIAAEQSGSSFENVTSAVSKFNVLIGNAAAGNAKAEATLKQYGITAKDTQGALEQAVTVIANMTSTTDQAAAAQALFKDRTGEILPVIKSFEGDLPGLISKLRDLGVLMSDEDAKAADEFGDQMDTLNTQLAAIGRTIGFAVMPVFLRFANSLSQWLAENKNELRAWAAAIGDAFELARKGLVQLYDDARRVFAAMQAIAALQTQGQFGPGAAVSIIQQTEAQIQADIEARNRIAGQVGGEVRLGGGGFGGGTAGASTKVNTIQIDQARSTQAEIAKAQLESFTATLDREFKLWDAQQQTILARFKADLAIKAISEQEYQTQLRTYEDERLAGQLANLELERNKRKELGFSILEIENEIKIKREEIDREMQERREKDANRKREDEERELEFLEKKYKSWQRHIEQLQQADELADRQASRSERAGDEEGGLGGILGGFLGGLGGPGGFGDFSIWQEVTDAAGNTTSVLKDAAQVVSDAWSTAGDVVGDALGQMASGLANMLSAWLAGGDVTAKALLQMTSQIALQLALQAGIEAIMETARGFAALAITWGVPNPKSIAHFAAAGVFATVAGIAGAVGVAAGLGARAVGGGSGSAARSSFSQQTGGTTQRERNVAGQGQAYSSYGDKAYIQEEGRNAPLGVDVRIKFEDKPAWFTQMFIAEWRANGRIRRLVEDGR